MKNLCKLLIILAITILNSCSGCQQKPVDVTQKPTPVECMNPVEMSPVRKSNSKSYVVPVFYGTDRMATGSKDPSDYYGNKRNTGFDVGVVNVSIPVVHTSGEIESPQWWKLWNRKDTSKYVLLVDIKKMESVAFFKQLKAVVDSSSENDAFIFIHGFNNSFSDAAKRTAQLVFDLGINGAPIMYSWPSQASVTKYTVDENENLWTIPHLKLFLTQVVEKTQAKRVNIVAHSMGNRALTQALKELSTENKAVRFNQVILAAPDIDAEIFQNNIAPYIKSTANHITMYCSSEDNALKLSKKVHGNYRAGDTDSKIITSCGIETIDASELKSVDFLDHSYFSTNRPVINDIFMLLNFNASPNSRNLLTIYQNDSTKYWTFKR